MRLDEVFKQIKSYDALGDINVKGFLTARRCDNNIMKVCMSVKDNLISLAGLQLSVDDMLSDDWDLLIHYSTGNGYVKLED